MKKQITSLHLFRHRQVSAPESVEDKVDAIVRQLADARATGEDIHGVSSYINRRLETLEPYRQFLAGHPEEADTIHTHELQIVIARGRSKRKEKMGMPNPIRLVISVLMITLGFAMIILPAPPYFEMYTIFYFNESDGFTLMDLISLIIVFCGIFTLILTMQKHKREN